MRFMQTLLAATLLVSQLAYGMATIEFMKLNPSQQYDAVKPIMLAFLSAGYKKVPDNPFTLVNAIERLAYEKGYTYQNLDDVAKEAATRLGMTR